MALITVRVSGDDVEPCPLCKNNTHFIARSMQSSEDSCEVWVECQCGHDPTLDVIGSRLESVWGILDKGSVGACLSTWSALIKLKHEQQM